MTRWTGTLGEDCGGLYPGCHDMLIIGNYMFINHQVTVDLLIPISHQHGNMVIIWHKEIHKG